MPILIKGGQVDLYFTDGSTLVLPPYYGLVHDTEGRHLDACSLFLGPFDDAGEFRGELPSDAADYFGNDYPLRRARLDVPDGRWEPVGRVAEIVYYRPGAHEGDWRHPFAEPQPLFEQRGWYWLRLPTDCELGWRGIVAP